MRLFWALPLPAGHQAWIAAVQADLRSRVHGARWSDPAQAHLTLCILGEVEASRVAELLESGRIALRGAGVIELAWTGLAAFPRPAAARTLALGAVPTDALVHAQGVLQAAMAAFVTLPVRAFRPHLTLARFKAPTRLSALPDVMPPPAHRAAAATLFRSILRPEGAVHEALGEAAFAD
jgi:2'-5' RNA ligase